MKTYTIRDISKILQLNYNHTLELLEQKKLGCIEIKNEIRITENQLKSFIEKKENNNKDVHKILEREIKKFKSERTVGDVVNEIYETN